MANSNEHDDVLFSILKECKTLPIFLDHIFGFLKRRTDFYVTASDESSPIGLRAGLAKEVVQKSFIKYANDNSPTSPVETKKDNSILKKPAKSINPSINLSDPSKSYNGNSFDNYSWSQTYNEIDLFLKLPPDISSKDLMVNITSKSVCIKTKKGNNLLQGELCQKCKLDCLWSVEGRELLLHLEKSKEIWWDCFLLNESKIDVSKIECTKPFEDLPEDAQAKIEELQWNQERKRQGLSTSDEIHSMNILKKAWNAEGSPFSGDFDPSVLSSNIL